MTEDATSPSDSEADPAAEFVLGLAQGPARVRALERLLADPVFRAEVEAWEQRLAPFLDQVAPIEPPSSVWDRVAASIAPETKAVAFARRAGTWNSVAFWRAATAASVVAAAACLAIVFLRPGPPLANGGPTLTATIATMAGKPLFVATVERSNARVVVVPVGALDGQGRFPELWIIRAGSQPAPVGMIDDGGPRMLSVAKTNASDVFAVSLEPKLGSPTGAPTGPVIATGSLKSL